MGGALSIFVLLSLSVLIIRVASVALRLTGLSEGTARFQALSAFTGTGFTTVEAETIVNYPLRRKIISLLMIVGNLGLVSVLATLVVSLVHTEAETGAVIRQLAWLLGGLGLVWFLILNKMADRLLCKAIGRFLESRTVLGLQRYHRLLQLGDGFSICEHPAAGIDRAELEALGLSLVAIHSGDGRFRNAGDTPAEFGDGDKLVVYGSDESHETLSQRHPL